MWARDMSRLCSLSFSPVKIFSFHLKFIDLSGMISRAHRRVHFKTSEERRREIKLESTIYEDEEKLN